LLTNYSVISRVLAILTKICRYHFNHKTVEGLDATVHLAWEYCRMFHWFLYGKLYSLFLQKALTSPCLLECARKVLWKKNKGS